MPDTNSSEKTRRAAGMSNLKKLKKHVDKAKAILYNICKPVYIKEGSYPEM